MINSPWTYAVTYLEMLFNDSIISSGSGFFWKNLERWYLITNWHNLSGRNPENGQPLSPTGALPDYVRCLSYERVGAPDPLGNIEMQIVTPTIPLYENADFGAPLWLEHPIFGRRVDVAAVALPDSCVNPNTQMNSAADLDGNAIISPFVSQDVFVVGYPLGLVNGLPIPIWKRGTIASEPEFDPDGLPKLFIDSATRKGMSGSLVIARHEIMGAFMQKDGTESRTIFARRDKILGVYSGRLHPSHVEAQLGVVWKEPTINATITGSRRARLNA